MSGARKFRMERLPEGRNQLIIWTKETQDMWQKN